MEKDLLTKKDFLKTYRGIKGRGKFGFCHCFLCSASLHKKETFIKLFMMGWSVSFLWCIIVSRDEIALICCLP
jgi:hypothetical protein